MELSAWRLATWTLPTETVTGMPWASIERISATDRRREPHHRHPRRNVEAECTGGERPVDEHRECARRRRLLHRVLGERSARQEHGLSRHRAHAVLREERLDPARGRATVDQYDAGGHRVGRRSAERHVVLVEDAEPRADEHAHGGRGKPSVRSRHRDRRLRSPGSRDAPVARTGASVVARGHDRQHVELRGAGDAPGKRPVGERRVRLDHAYQRDARCVVRIPVVVGVDRGLEPGEDLVGARVDAVAALGVRLPAADAHGQDRRAGCDPVQAVGSFRPRDDPGELRGMALRSPGDGRVRLRNSTAPRVEDVDTRQDATAEVRMGRIDPRVEQRHGHAGAVEAGHLRGPRRRRAGRRRRRRPAPGRRSGPGRCP